MKILFLIRALGGVAGGAERVLSEVASELAKRGHLVEVASHDGPDVEDFYPLDSRIVRHRLGKAGAGAIRDLLSRNKPDVAVGMMYSAYLPLALAAYGTGLPIVASEHTAYAHYRSRPLLALALRAAAHRFAAITVPSTKVQKGFPRPVERHMKVVPNPVAQATGNRIEGRGPVLLAVGNLRAEKGHAQLIDAFARLAAQYPEWRLRIVGEGELRGELERQAAKLGITDRVELPGAVTAIEREYARAAIFAMPSHYESFGIATAEALAAGVPAIGFADCPGTNELIIDGVNGVLVEGFDRVRVLADGLAKLIGSPKLQEQLGLAGPRSVEGFKISTVADQWEKLLQDALTMKQNPAFPL